MSSPETCFEFPLARKGTGDPEECGVFWGSIRTKASFVGLAVAVGSVGLAGAWWLSTVHAQQVPRHEPVKKAQIEQWKKELSNWGRWGANDERGALNLITPAKRKQAAGLVKEGFSVSLA